MLRFFFHLWYTLPFPHPLYNQANLQAMAAKNHALEQLLGNELRIIIEKSLPWPLLFQGVTTKQRAVMLFSEHLVWDTAENDGILLYISVADSRLEIVVDRAYRDKTKPEEWQAICDRACTTFKRQDYRTGLIQLLEDIFALAHQHFQPKAHTQELPDQPLVQ